MRSDKPLSFRQLSALVFGAVALYWGLNHLSPIAGALGILFGFLFPFVLGCLLAFLLNIPLRAVERGLLRLNGRRPAKWLRPTAMLLTLLAVLGVLAGVLLVVVPQVLSTAQSVSQRFPDFLKECQVLLGDLTARYPELLGIVDSLDLTSSALPEKLTALLSELGSRILSSSLSLATSVFSGVVNFGIAFIFALYILAGKETLLRQCGHLFAACLPSRWEARLRSLARLIDHTFSGFFTGQCLEACILGLLFFVSMSLLRFPYAVLIAVLIAFTALVPVFGAFIGCLVGTVLILVEDPVRALWFVVLFLVLQQLEGNLIYPRVVGSSVGLPPIWVLVAVTLGGSMFGVAGMLLFIPTVSVLYTLLRDAVRRRLRVRSAETGTPPSAPPVGKAP